jgi:hypothetical protein
MTRITETLCFVLLQSVDLPVVIHFSDKLQKAMEESSRYIHQILSIRSAIRKRQTSSTKAKAMEFL